MGLISPAEKWPQSDSSRRKGRRRLKWPTYARVAYFEAHPRKVTVIVDQERTAQYVARAHEDNIRWRRSTNDRIHLAR
jgi:hypothetical protein